MNKYLLLTLSIFFLVCSLDAQNVSVTFRVNMSYMIDQSKFDPAMETVDIAGNFNNWGDPENRLTDGNGDEIYEITLPGFSANQSIEFKFRINGAWNGREEFAGGGANRGYTVSNTDNIIEVWYNNEVPPGGAPIANFSLNVKEIFTGSIVQFTNNSAGDFNEVFWTFEGGVPFESAALEPVIRYDTPGNFDVSLIVSDGDESDTFSLNNYVEVAERDFTEIEWWNDAVFYEVFVRSFFDQNGDGIGDFKGLTEKLDYLNDGDPETNDDLGVTGIWLMPINTSPSYHGYDVIDYKSINSQFGTMDDFKAFLDAAHERGIRVIIDFVMNHSSSQHPWFTNSSSSPTADKRDWYRWSATNPGTMGWHSSASGFYYGYFWSGMPDLNYETQAVKDAMFDVADFWLNEIGIDGFRLDAVKYIVEDGANVENTEATFQFWKEYQNEIKSLKSDAFSVGEAWTSTSQILKYVKDGGLDYCFEFDLAGSIIDAVNTQNSKNVINKVQESYNAYPHLQVGTFLTNHDQDRLMDRMGNFENRVKTAANIYLTLPGIPYLYYGEEIGMNGVRTTNDDRPRRRPMQWDDTDNAGFTSGTAWYPPNTNYTSFNVEDQSSDDNSMLSHYRNLIHLRNETEELRRGGFRQIGTTDNRIIAFERNIEESSVLVFISLSSSPISNKDFDMGYTSFMPGLYQATNLINGDENMIEIDGDGILLDLDFSGREIKVLRFSETTSVTNEMIVEDLINLYPVPARDQVFVDFLQTDIHTIPYRIINSVGQKIAQGKITAKDSISVQTLTSGIYFIDFMIDKRILRKKVVVEHP